MNTETFKIPTPDRERPLSILAGASFAVLLFVVMALVQMIGDVEPPTTQIEEMTMAYTPPEIEEIEEDRPPPPEEEPPPPDLEAPPPQLSLAQLELALDPGTGGSLVGDFAMPVIATTSASLGTEDFVDFSDLDQLPRPLPGSRLEFPRRLMRTKVDGSIVVLLKLGDDGRVLDVKVERSNLPQFDDVVLAQVRDWRFTPPTKEGRPVKAQAELPIPIRIE